MKFLTGTTLPKLTITRRRRKVVFNHVRNISTFTETTTRIELTLPSFITGIRESWNRLADGLAAMFLPRVYAL